MKMSWLLSRAVVVGLSLKLNNVESFYLLEF